MDNLLYSILYREADVIIIIIQYWMSQFLSITCIWMFLVISSWMKFVVIFNHPMFDVS